MANRMRSPSTDGVRPRMSKMYDGKNTATRPIPIIRDSSDERAIAAAAADQRPKTSAVQFPKTGGIGGANVVYGDKVDAPGNVIGGRSATFNPATGTQNFE